ncbi:hypothetical protein SKAU_G00206240 [Synaphobranchus kaupii]|uniref:Uncharacterized protein n=1 Tax=Synaphobranchus kaupii TaxID=118154 RepID=A0A9Q1FGU9_SYNKA|nr:hypothetical protein SKAU_G00206240 [Synaphobranchus kaupii]
MAMLAQQMQLANAIMPGTQLQPMPMFSVAPGLATSPSAAAFNPYLGPVSPGLMQAELLSSAPMLMTSSPSIPVPGNAAARPPETHEDRPAGGMSGVPAGQLFSG